MFSTNKTFGLTTLYGVLSGAFGMVGTIFLAKFLPRPDYVYIVSTLYLFVLLNSILSFGLTLEYPHWGLRDFARKLPSLVFYGFLISISISTGLYFFNSINGQTLVIFMCLSVFAPLVHLVRYVEVSGLALSLAQWRLKFAVFSFLSRTSLALFFPVSALIIVSSIIGGFFVLGKK